MNSHGWSQPNGRYSNWNHAICEAKLAVALNSVEVTKSKTKCNNLLTIVLFKGNFESTYFLASFLNVLALNMSVILGRS